MGEASQEAMDMAVRSMTTLKDVYKRQNQMRLPMRKWMGKCMSVFGQKP